VERRRREDDAPRLRDQLPDLLSLRMDIEERTDIVFSDLVMPIVDRRELVRGMRALPCFRDTPVVMMSGSIKANALSDPGG
jgi:CheY-like chemotaxis protein